MDRIIHYCWFGNGQKSATVLRCIESWKTFFPGWEIREWNERNFDVHCNTYVSQAYDSRKWAFVSDYCRFWALEQYGGIYFDTDVEVIRSFKELIDNNDAFAGFETDKAVAPGLVLFAKEKSNLVIRRVKEYYESIPFLDEDGERIRVNVCGIFGKILDDYGFNPNGQLQKCAGMTLYPKDYFCPFDDATGVLHKTQNTYSIHWYDKTWFSTGRKLRCKCTRILHRMLGKDLLNNFLRKIGIRR